MLRLLVLPAALLLPCLAQSSWSDDFTSLDTSRWGVDDGEIQHCGDGACVALRADHVTFSPAGATQVMNQVPCKASPKECCKGRDCATYASGHLLTTQAYLYGRFEVSMRVAHPTGGSGSTPSNGEWEA